MTEKAASSQPAQAWRETHAQPAIEARGLTKVFRSHYGRRRAQAAASGTEPAAVSDVDVAIAQGEIFGLIGPNGAGKTTLIKMLCTLLLPTRGTARVCGHDVVAGADRVRTQVGLVASNERSFYWRLTGRQNLQFFAALYGIRGAGASRWIDELLDVLELRELADERFDGYSTGGKQRLAIARGLLSKPRILFLDEPTKGLDPMMSAALIAFIRDRILKLWNQTIVITTHNLREIEQLCHRVGVMHRGKMLASGRLEDLRALVTGNTTYLLGFTIPAEPVAAAIAQLSGIVAPPVAGAHRIEVRVDATANPRALPQMLAIVACQGGEVLTCQSVEPSLDQVLESLVHRASARECGSPDGRP